MLLTTPAARGLRAARAPRNDEPIRGLLLVFLVMQGATLLLDVVALRTLPTTFRAGTWALGALSPLYRPLLVAEAVARVLVVLLPIIGFVLTFRRSPLAPGVWVGYLAVCVVYGLLEAVGTRLVAAQLAVPLLQRGESTSEVERLAQSATLTGVRTIVYGLVWGAWWLLSDRADRTFAPRPAAPLVVALVAIVALAGCAQHDPAPDADSARVAAAIAPSLPESLAARAPAPAAQVADSAALAPPAAAPATAPATAPAAPAAPPVAPPTTPAASAAGDTGAIAATAGELASLGAALVVPVVGVRPAELLDTFNETRDGGTRRHEALDIPAPRGTPVLSAAAGTLLKKFDSRTGGLMVYAADASDRFVLLYGHLDRYADGLVEGQPLARGQVIGYVGTTGNAPPNLPHLHFGIARARNVAKWWTGTPVDPLPLLQGSGGSTR